MAISEWVKNLRDVIGTDLVVMPAASAIITDENGRVLLQRCLPGKSSSSNAMLPLMTLLLNTLLE